VSEIVVIAKFGVGAQGFRNPVWPGRIGTLEEGVISSCLMKDSLSAGSGPNRHNRWLVLIAAYKVLQSLLFIAIGVGALRLLHKDVGDLIETLADHLHFNSEWRITQFALDKAELVNDPLLRRIGVAAFCYAALGLAEGTGLYLEQAWGEILTLVITASFLPWELFEVAHRVTWFRMSLFTINLAVFFYLLILIGEQRRMRRQLGKPEGVKRSA
jgi:uncharacterized membrane protein (DUF2068 family)